MTVSKLKKFEVGQSKWYYQGYDQCTKSMTHKDGKFMCYANHESQKHVLMCYICLNDFALNMLICIDVVYVILFMLFVEIDTNLRFMLLMANTEPNLSFWDSDCAKLFGISVIDLKIELVEVFICMC